MFSGCSENERSLLSLSIPGPGGSIGDQVTLLGARTPAVQSGTVRSGCRGRWADGLQRA